MLAQWCALTDLNSGANTKGKKHVTETNEAREGRLRESYEKALSQCNDGNTLEAKDALLLISKELRSISVEESVPSPKRKHLGSPKAAKRVRLTNEAAWIQSLRYAVNRNLGDLFMTLGDPSEALRSYGLALDDDDSDFVIWMRAARAASTLGQLHVARRAYETALQIRPGHFLCRDNYFSVLRAIGDLDEDVGNEIQFGLGHPGPESAIDEMTVELLTNRHSNYEKERQQSREADSVIDTVHVQEARWMAVIDAVGDAMSSRLGKSKNSSSFPVGARIKILIDGQEAETMDISSPEKLKESHELRSVSTEEASKGKGSKSSTNPEAQDATKDNNDVVEVVEVIEVPSEDAMDDTTATGGKGNEEKKPSKKTSSPPPDPRRSLRQRATEEPIISTTEEPHDEFLDSMLSLCRMAANMNFEDTTASPEPDAGTADAEMKPNSEPVNSEKPEKRESCNTWASVISEKKESKEVILFCKSLSMDNSGPLDVLLKILDLLAKKESSQFFSELAQVWLQLRKFAIIDIPGTTRVSVCVVEALLVSALKVKKTKTTKLEEAARLLTIVSATLAESVSANSSDEKNSEIDYLMLSLRCTWLFCHLNEKNSRLAEAFAHASRSLDLAKQISDLGVAVMSKDSGPEFADSETSKVIEIFEEHVVRLKRSSELQKATEELAIAPKGSRSSASKALAILAPSIRESVQQLGLDRWAKSDIPLPAHASKGMNPTEGKVQSSLLDAEEELESRLVVFGEACTKSRDSVGELVCHSIRLRIAIISYWARLERERVERPRKRNNQDGPGSSSGKLLEMFVQIRKYVAIVKNISSMPSFSLASPTLEKSGWSLSDAVQIACHALIALCELLCKMIPVLSPTASGSSLLSASQKNQRLAFTRCILAFCRCLELLMKLSIPAVNGVNEMVQGNAKKDTAVPSSRLLAICAFCLRVLANRGCCREEGTSGALIKLYMFHLCVQLRELAGLVKAEPVKETGPKNSNESDGNGGIVILIDDSDDDDPSSARKEECLSSLSYDWSDVSLVRQQLAQCYRCLYRLPDLETSQYSGKEAACLQWLENGCRAATQLGLSFVTGDVAPSTPKMNADTVRGVYFFYRKRLFEEFAAHHRDGSRAKVAREIISEIISVLPDDPPADIPTVSFSDLDAVVSAAVEAETSREEACKASVLQMHEEWRSKISSFEKTSGANLKALLQKQTSIMYFEAYVLSVVGNLAAYDSDYKKNRNISRRKAPKEVVERLFTASSDCVIALRCRPWSIGAWILLGRIFVELADVALDEREMVMSTFGVFRPEDLSSAEGGETAEGIMGRAEVCFGFARALAHGTWQKEECTLQADTSAIDVYGEAHQSANDTFWCGFGDDGDLFGALGLSNKTTSRPWFAGEQHPEKEAQVDKGRQMAAIHFGRSALLALRARESRYWYQHWNVSTLAQSDPAQKTRPLPDDIAVDVKEALASLNEGLQLVFADESENSSVYSNNLQVTTARWRRDLNVFEKQQWYYIMRRAQLKRKLGYSAQEYLADFASALSANGKLRAGAKMLSDIETLYQLHAARAKLLLCPETGNDEDILNIIVQHAYNPALTETAANLRITPLDASVQSRVDPLRRAIGEDILAAMKTCRGKSELTFSEFYFKSIYYGTLMYREILGERERALSEISPLFRGEASAKAIESNSDGIHRGYFYVIWNYRYTDTGSEPTIESERKLVRWRFKMLSLYGRLLREFSDRRTLAGIISRLKRRAPDDLPVDGALLDDLILAYADITRVKILSTPSTSATYAADCDLSFRQTWLVFVESLRLVQGVRRVRMFINRDEPSGIQPKRLFESKRPWCQVAIANVLHLERLRWLAITKNAAFHAQVASALPFQGLPENCSAEVLNKYASTMEECGQRWKIDMKLHKLLQRRISTYRKMHASRGSPTQLRRISNANDNSSALDTPVHAVVTID